MTNTDLPGNLGGANPLANWLNRIRRAIARRTLMPGNGYKVKQTESGTLLEIIGAGGKVTFPFKIYQSDTWLKFKVREGIVITTGEAITPTGIDTEITIDSGTEKHWIYLDITADAASVENDATLPTWTVDKIPIGWIDASDEENEISEIHQFVHDNIFVPCVT